MIGSLLDKLAQEGAAPVKEFAPDGLVGGGLRGYCMPGSVEGRSELDMANALDVFASSGHGLPKAEELAELFDKKMIMPSLEALGRMCSRMEGSALSWVKMSARALRLADPCGSGFPKPLLEALSQVDPSSSEEAAMGWRGLMRSIHDLDKVKWAREVFAKMPQSAIEAFAAEDAPWVEGSALGGRQRELDERAIACARALAQGELIERSSRKPGVAQRLRASWL